MVNWHPETEPFGTPLKVLVDEICTPFHLFSMWMSTPKIGGFFFPPKMDSVKIMENSQTLWTNGMIWGVKKKQPGDSKWPLYPLVGGHLTFERDHLSIPKRSQRIARKLFLGWKHPCVVSVFGSLAASMVWTTGFSPLRLSAWPRVPCCFWLAVLGCTIGS